MDSLTKKAKDPNKKWKENVKCLNVIHDNLSIVRQYTEKLQDLEDRKIVHEAMRTLSDKLAELDNRLDHRGR